MSSISFTGKASFTRRALTAAAMSGALSVATLGMAGQAGASTSNGTPSQAHPAVCRGAQRRTTHWTKRVAAVSKRLDREEALEAKASNRHGRLTHLKKIVAHEKKLLAQVNGKAATRQAKLSKTMTKACSPPAASQSTTATTGGTSTSQA
jgi:hypothetical protein